MFEIVDGRTTDDDGRTPEHGYTISSPCEPKGSGELISGSSPFSVKDNINILSEKERCMNNNHIMEYYKKHLDL